MKGADPECVIIGENWHNAASYLRGDQYDSVMNYAFTKACLDFFALGTLDAEGFASKLNGLLMRNTDTVNNMMLNLLDSHDTYRFFTQVEENVVKLSTRAVAQIWTPTQTFFSDLAKDPFRLPGEQKYLSEEALQKGLETVDEQIYSAIHTLN